MSPFDLIVVGTGGAGTAAALRCAQARWRVAIVDERPYGGTCALRGCDPKKILVGAAELKDCSDRMRGSGIAGETRIEWADLMRFKRTFTDPVPEKREPDLIKAGVTAYHGAARFRGPASLSVAGDLLPARHIVLATGARPTTLELDGEAHLITSTDFLDLQRLPRRICFIGGGYIAFEFAHVAARAGASPVILQRDRNRRANRRANRCRRKTFRKLSSGWARERCRRCHRLRFGRSRGRARCRSRWAGARSGQRRAHR